MERQTGSQRKICCTGCNGLIDDNCKFGLQRSQGEAGIMSRQFSLRKIRALNLRFADGCSIDAARCPQVIGQIEQVDFLKALEPKYAMLGDLESVSRAGLGDEMINAMIDNLKFWQADVDEACARAKFLPVKDIMEPINRSIEQEASLAEAIHKFVIWQTRRIPIKSGHEIIGILRLTDVFNNVTEYMDEIP